MPVLKKWFLPLMILGIVVGGAHTASNTNALTMTRGHYYCFSEISGEAEEEAIKQSDGTYKCKNGSADVHEFTGEEESKGEEYEEGEGTEGTSTSGESNAIILTSCDRENGADKIMCVLKIGLDILTVGIGVVGVLGIVIVGIQYLTAGGNEEQTRKAKRRMFEIVIGLVAYVLLYALLSWLLPGGIGS